MSVMTMPADVERLFTVADLERTPDDGCRYELIDGALLVSPAPAWRHQEAAMTLYMVLRLACPRELRVIGGPFGVRQDDFNEVQPDVLVARYSDMTDKNLPRAPLLAVEVVSPSTRLRDASLKKAFYARLGAPSYWLVDPVKPAVTAFELADGRYSEVAYVEGASRWEASKPFAVSVCPADLVRGLLP
jgi:Uma2 family endonuclease